MATSFATKKLLWLKMLLQELSFPQKDTTIILNNSQGNFVLLKNMSTTKEPNTSTYNTIMSK
jgi:hypothetical protein